MGKISAQPLTLIMDTTISYCHYTQTAIMKTTSQSENWRAFLKSPKNFSGPQTFHGTFRARFSRSKKCLSKRLKSLPIVSGIFPHSVMFLRAKKSRGFSTDSKAVPVK